MTDSDIEIVLALAHGTLSGEAEERARARVDADPELARELVAQIAAIEALEDLPSVSLSTEERSTLRSSLMTQLHLEPAAAPAPPPGRASRWWKPVVGLAAVAVAAVAFVAVPGLLFGNNSADEVALVATDATAREESADAAQGGAVDQAESAPFVTSASAEDLAVESFGLVEIPESQAGLLLTRSTAVDSTNDGIEKIAGDGVPLTPVDFAVLEDCIDSLGDSLPGENLVPLAVTTTDGTQLVHLGVGAEGVVTSVISIDLDTCRVTSTIP